VPKKKDHKALIKASALPERSVAICMNPELFAQMQELERDLRAAEAGREAAGASLSSGGPARELAEQFEAVRLEMLEHTLTFRLRALPRRKFTALQAEFPPREGNTADAVAGTNIEALSEAMVRRCLFEPELDDEDWQILDDTMSDGQWQLLANAAWAINARDVDVPFSRVASRILQASADE
jgi:hypothetical protein